MRSPLPCRPRTATRWRTCGELMRVHTIDAGLAPSPGDHLPDARRRHGGPVLLSEPQMRCVGELVSCSDPQVPVECLGGRRTPCPSRRWPAARASARPSIATHERTSASSPSRRPAILRLPQSASLSSVQAVRGGASKSRCGNCRSGVTCGGGRCRTCDLSLVRHTGLNAVLTWENAGRG